MAQGHLPAAAMASYRRSRLPFARPQTLQTSAGLQGNNSYSYMPLPSVFQGVQACRLPARKTPQMLRCSSHAVCQLRHCPFMVVQACRLPARKTPQMLPCSSHAVCQPRHCPFMVVQACRLPARKTPQMLPCSSHAVCQQPRHCPFMVVQACRLPARKTPQMLPCSSHAVCQPRHCPFMVVQACRLPARKNPPNASLQLPCRLPAPALSFYGGSSLPFASRAKAMMRRHNSWPWRGKLSSFRRSVPLIIPEFQNQSYSTTNHTMIGGQICLKI